MAKNTVLDNIIAWSGGIIVVSFFVWFFSSSWINSSNIEFIVDHSIARFTKIGSESALLNLKCECPMNISFYVACDYDEPKYIEGRRYDGWILPGRDTVYEGTNDVNFALVGLEENKSYTCRVRFSNFWSNGQNKILHLPEFRTIEIPQVEMFSFSKNTGVIVGSVHAKLSDELVWWIEYGTAKNPYQLHTDEKFLSGSTESSDCAQDFELKVEFFGISFYKIDDVYRARIVVKDPTGREYRSNSMTAV